MLAYYCTRYKSFDLEIDSLYKTIMYTSYRRGVLLVGDWHCAYVLLYGPRSLEVAAKSEDTLASEDVPMQADTSAN